MRVCLTGCRELRGDEEVIDGEVRCPQCDATVEIAVGISGRRFVKRHYRPCHHTWSPLDSAPDCTGTVYECTSCQITRCFDGGAWAAIDLDAAIEATAMERLDREEARNGL